MEPLEWSSNLASYPVYLRPRIKRGRGMKVGKHYKPWHGLREGRRRGTTGLPVGLKTGRMHDLRSLKHRAYFMLLERDETVVDIRERFPILHIDETLKLCAANGVPHLYSGSTPEPFLIDFLITRAIDGGLVYQARSLQEVEANSTTPTGLHVIRDWCESKGIDWKKVDTDGLTQQLLDSLIYLRNWRLHRYQPDHTAIKAFCHVFHRQYKRHQTLKEILELCSSKLGEPLARCDNHFRFAAWSKKLPVDVRHPILLNSPVVLLNGA